MLLSVTDSKSELGVAAFEGTTKESEEQMEMHIDRMWSVSDD